MGRAMERPPAKVASLAGERMTQATHHIGKGRSDLLVVHTGPPPATESSMVMAAIPHVAHRARRDRLAATPNQSLFPLPVPVRAGYGCRLRKDRAREVS